MENAYENGEYAIRTKNPDCTRLPFAHMPNTHTDGSIEVGVTSGNFIALGTGSPLLSIVSKLPPCETLPIKSNRWVDGGRNDDLTD